MLNVDRRYFAFLLAGAMTVSCGSDDKDGDGDDEHGNHDAGRFGV